MYIHHLVVVVVFVIADIQINSSWLSKKYFQDQPDKSRNDVLDMPYASWPIYRNWAHIALMQCLIFPLWLYLVGRSGPHDKISTQKPAARLLRAPNMFSLLIHVLILTAGQTGALLLLQIQTWYDWNKQNNIFKMKLIKNHLQLLWRRCSLLYSLHKVSAL